MTAAVPLAKPGTLLGNAQRVLWRDLERAWREYRHLTDVREEVARRVPAAFTALREARQALVDAGLLEGEVDAKAGWMPGSPLTEGIIRVLRGADGPMSAAAIARESGFSLMEVKARLESLSRAWIVDSAPRYVGRSGGNKFMYRLILEEAP